MTRAAYSMTDNDKAVTAKWWSENLPSSDAFSPSVYWLAVPSVQRRYQRRACNGGPYHAWHEYCFKEFLGGTRGSDFLSIGCGTGALERDLYRLGAFVRCHGIDLSTTAIDVARQEAVLLGAAEIQYSVFDIESQAIDELGYDAVWFNGSLHHIERLEDVCAKVHAALRPSGWLFLNEYVGQNRFAFDQHQQEIIQAAFRLIPAEYRRSFVPATFGAIQTRVGLPNPDEVANMDPSEAIRSQEILAVVGRYFDICALNACGGSILQFLLHGIAGNFKENDERAMKILDMLFAIEDSLIDTGSLNSDFVLLAARPKTGF